MANLKNVIYLSNEDYETLVSTGTVTIDGETLTYDENNVYITPDKLASTTEDGLMSAADKSKLDNIESGAQVNVQADWNQTDIGADDYIKNKPEVDTDFSLTSTNPIQNKVISERLKDISNTLTHIKYKLFGVTSLSEVDYKVDYATIYPIPETLSDTDGTHRVVYSDTQLKEIEGNSFAFNQLQKIQVSSQTRTSNGVTLTDNRDGTYTVNGTATADANFGIGVISMQAHKYLIKGCPSGGSIQTYYVTDSYTFGFSDVGNGAIYNKSSAGDFTYYIRIKNGTTVNNLVFRPQVFDLTQNGIDFVTTVDEAKAELLKRGINVDEYNEFNAGEIKNTIISGIKVNGYNLFDGQLENGYIDNTGAFISSSGDCQTDYVQVIPGRTYVFGDENFTIANGRRIFEYDENKNFIKNTNHWNTTADTITLANNTRYVAISYNGTSKPSSPEICIRLTNSRTGYAPYKEPHIITIQQTELLSTDLAHDTIKFVEGNIIAGQQRYNMVHVGRINNVDLGTLNWTLYTGLGDTILYWATSSDIKLSSDLLCSSLTQVPAVYNTGDDNSISSHSSQTRVYARTTNAQATASDFKTAMSGVILNYEKNKYTETTLATDLTFEEVSAIIEQGGSIEALFENVPPNLKTAFVVNKVIVS